MSAAKTTPECPIVPAAISAHPLLHEMSQLSILTDKEERIGDFMVSRETAHYHATCERCLGKISVRHFFVDAEMGQHVKAEISDSCPLKPKTEDAPVLFIESLPGQQG